MGEEVAAGTEAIPPDEPSILDALADDPVDLSLLRNFALLFCI